MALMGKMNRLKVIRKSGRHVFLDGEEFGEIMIVLSVPEEVAEGDGVEVFLFTDGEGRPAAVEARPKAALGEVALLKVVSVSESGAFLDWGLPKDLFVPYMEQAVKMKPGEYHMVYIFLDRRTGRIAATSRLNRHISSTSEKFREGDEVEVVVCEETPLGYKAIVENTVWGMLYKNELFRQVKRGKKLTGYIKKIREDGRIDLSLQKPGPELVENTCEKIIAVLEAHDGMLAVTDSSPAEVVYRMFGVSKKTFKKAVGMLYRQRRILLDKNLIRLAS